MDLVVHEGAEEVGALADAWRDLESRCSAHPFQSHAFAQAFCDTLCDAAHATPIVVTASDEERLVALFPANVVLYGPVRLIDWLGGPYLVDFGDVLFDAGSAHFDAAQFVESSIDELRRRRRTGALLYLSNVREDAVAWDALQGHLTVYKSSAAPYLRLTGGFDAVLDSMTRKHRHNYERRCRRLAESGEVAFEVIRPHDADFDGLLARLLELQRERYEGHGPSVLYRQCIEAFYARFARLSEGVTLGCLRVDGHPVALSYQCTYRDRTLGLTSAFDPAYASLGPSVLLKGRVIEDCARQGLAVMDFGWGAQHYKLEWTTESVALSTFVSPGVGGRLLRAAAQARRRLHSQHAGSAPGT